MYHDDKSHYFRQEWLPGSIISRRADVIIYGGTAAGVIAAIRCAMSGVGVILANPGWVVGGMTSGGLGYTDFGNKDVIGGLSREFYRRVGAHYQQHEAWKFEPHVGRNVLEDWLAEWSVTVIHGLYLDRVLMDERTLTGLRFLDGSTLYGSIFMDSTYEGDLMASAGVSYRIGRESSMEYGEIHNGAQIHNAHQFDGFVDPWRIPGEQSSGLCWGIQSSEQYTQGKGDGYIQAYNFRMCLTDDKSNQIPFNRPVNFNTEFYELAARWLSFTRTDVFLKFDRVTRSKTDTNNHGAFSTDFIGGSWEWPLADHQKRESIFQLHVDYQSGLHWFMANDKRVPNEIRERYSCWGLAADEFGETGFWPHQLYVREARRMVSDYMLTEKNCLASEAVPDPIGMAAYQMDSHNVRRIVVHNTVINEGDVQVMLDKPYGISWRAIVPPSGQVTNLTVPICVSASHIAYGSLRMEPVFMVIADSAAQAMILALRAKVPLRALPYDELAASLRSSGQVLETAIENLDSGNP